MDESTNISQIGYFDVPVVGSDIIFFQLQLLATVNVSNLTGIDINGYGASDFFDTASFSVAALDAYGNNISSAADLIFAESDLPINFASVPEPTTAAMLGTGLSLLWALRRRRKAKA